MKKTLALVLALVMVLALVPAAFAATATTTQTTHVNQNGYKVIVKFKEEGASSVDDKYLNAGPFTATGAQPAVVVKAPYNNIDNRDNGGDIWATKLPSLEVVVDGLDKSWQSENPPTKVYVNGKELTTYWTDFANGQLSFLTQITDANAVYDYELVLEYKDPLTAPTKTVTETVKFTIQYTNTQKPVYELKFNQPDTTGVVLKDGVYFIDSNTSSMKTLATDANGEYFTVNVAKNDGSKFTEVAYYGEGDVAAPTAVQTKTVSSKSQITVHPTYWHAKTANKEEKIYVTVETQYAFYQGALTYKYRTDVAKIDPRGISFAKDEYTIGINEVLKPTYNTIVPVYNDIAAEATLSVLNGEKNVIDVDGNKITGLKEGTVYVTATYNFDNNGVGASKPYTATAKITVKGTYQVTDKANYVVTTKSGNLNVRASASTSAKKIGSLKKGDVVEVVEIKNGWAKIVYPAANYTNGYVSAQYLTKQGTKPETVVGTKTVIARVLNVRSGAGTSYSIVGKLTRNTKVEVIETVASGKWAKIKFNNGYAYVSCTYLQ